METQGFKGIAMALAASQHPADHNLPRLGSSVRIASPAPVSFRKQALKGRGFPRLFRFQGGTCDPAGIQFACHAAVSVPD
jgi:hypothetical protein